MTVTATTVTDEEVEDVIQLSADVIRAVVKLVRFVQNLRASAPE